jgi:hypothetical protein
LRLRSGFVCFRDAVIFYYYYYIFKGIYLINASHHFISIFFKKID